MKPEPVYRWLQLGQFAAGVLIFTVGVAQCIFSRPFRRDRNLALGMLGVAGVLYGLRLLEEQPDIRTVLSAPPLVLAYVDAFLTYVLLVPVLYFFELTFGAGWRESIRWLRIAATVYAVGAVAIDAMTKTPRAANGPNQYFAVITIALLVWNTVAGRVSGLASWRPVRVGLLVFGAFVLFENLVDARVLGGRWNVEWAGVLVLLGCLAYVAVSTALDNDRRLLELRHELETARQIQASILPRGTPRVDGVELAARYLPMTDVAGDFYDFLELGPDRIGVLVADVSGHGVPAALIASMVKVALVAQSGHGGDPARVLAGLNQIFCGRLERQFVTAAYACIDTAGDCIRYGSAGHPPALLTRADGSIEALAENGVMLGQFPEWVYRSVERPFRPGDRLLLYTDGLTEATDEAGVFFDGDRLAMFARREREHGADAFAGALVDHVASWAGRLARGFDDDVTVVVADRVRV